MLKSLIVLLVRSFRQNSQQRLHARLLPQSTIVESNKDELISCKEIEKPNHDRSAHDLPILPVGCTVTYFDHMSKVWVVGRIAECTHDHAYLIETEAGRLVSHNSCDIRQSDLTFVPISKPNLKLQLCKAQKSDSGLAPVSPKPSVKQATVKCPTTRHSVTHDSSQATGGPMTHSGRLVCKPDKLNL